MRREGRECLEGWMLMLWLAWHWLSHQVVWLFIMVAILMGGVVADLSIVEGVVEIVGVGNHICNGLVG